MGFEEIDVKKRSKSIFEAIKKTPFNYVPLGVMKGLGLKTKRFIANH